MMTKAFLTQMALATASPIKVINFFEGLNFGMTSKEVADYLNNLNKKVKGNYQGISNFDGVDCYTFRIDGLKVMVPKSGICKFKNGQLSGFGCIVQTTNQNLVFAQVMKQFGKMVSVLQGLETYFFKDKLVVVVKNFVKISF